MARTLTITRLSALLLGMAVVLVLMAQGAEAKAPPPGSGAEDVPANILLMLDTSGSMDEVIQEGESEYPVDVAFDSSGNTYVATYYDYVEKYDTNGDRVLTFGGYGTSNGKFDNIFAIAIDSNNNIWVSDYNNNRVQKFDTNGNYLGKFSVSGSRAYGVGVDSSGNIYAINGDGDLEKHSVTSPYAKIGSTWDLPSTTRHVGVDTSNNIWVTDYKAYTGSGATTNNNRRVRRYNTSGTLQSNFSPGFAPYGIGADPDGYLFITDRDNNRIYKFSPNGTFIQYWGSAGSSAGEWDSPRGVEKGPSGVIYAADYYNNRIQSPTGTTPIQPLVEMSRLEAMKIVIKALVSDSELTEGANFGMMSWNSSATMKVNVSDDGALDIYDTVDALVAGGGTVLDSGMTLASSYMLGASTPMISGADCQQNILIVISDGYWTDSTASNTAESLYDNYNIKTFTVGFQTTDNANYVALSQKGGTYPDSPLYADSPETMLEVLSDYIREVISAQLSFSTPTIMPGTSGDDYLLQATFAYREDHQWKGHLFKYALTDAGLVGSTLWDAGEVLNGTAASARNIWTVGNGIPSGMNNFVVENIDRLRVPLGEASGTTYTDPQLTSLINFVRGMDSYSEYPTGEDEDNVALLAGERWKLADIYHSRSVVVGAPSAYTSDEASADSETYYRFLNGYFTFRHSANCGGSCEDRDEVVYVGSNGGMLHAFDSDTGAEKWAFVPPSVLPTFKDMISPDAATSASIYGVDGTPVVKDIYYNGAWRTILMAGLRQGGHSYFALDVTDPNNPTHLFTIASFPSRSLVSYWDASGVRTDYNTALVTPPAEYDFRTLGEAWSEPVILNIMMNGSRHWVAVLGGGYNSGVSSTYGARLFVLDLEDGGKIIQNLSIADGDSTNSIVNSVPPRVTAITADSTNLFQKMGAMVYVSDLEGKLWKVNLSDEGTLYETTKLFNAQATSANDRYSYHETTATITPDLKLIQYFGTADIQSLSKVSASIANRAYGIYDSTFPDFTSLASPHTVTNLQNVTTAGAACPSGTQQGWYINLDSNEKVTGKMTIANQTVFIPRYLPDSAQVCQAGTAKLTEVNYTCGSNTRNTDLGSGMPAEVVVYKNKLYIGISSDAELTTPLADGFVKQGNLIIGNPAVEGTGTVRVETWKEEF